MLFKERLVEQRMLLGLSKKEVAREINIEQSTYGKYELGHRQPSLEILQKLAEYFGTTTSYLIGETDDPSPPNAKKQAPSQISLEEAIRTNPDLSEESKKDMLKQLKLVKIRDNLKAKNEAAEELSPKLV